MLAEHDVAAGVDRLHELADENLPGLERIIRTVRDLETFSRIEREDVELLDRNEVVATACQMTANEIHVRSRHDGDHVELTVQDTGRGMSEAIHRRIFEPFSTTRAAAGGTGL